MPKLRKRRKLLTDIENRPDASFASPNPTLSGTRSRTIHKPQYRHYAANIRYSRYGRTQDNLSGTSEIPSINVIISVFIVSVLICFGSMPDATLRMLLLGELSFCNFPPIFANWTILIAILLPMKIQSRIEVVLGLAMFSWISSLGWAYAWERVTQKIVHGQGNNRDALGSKVGW